VERPEFKCLMFFSRIRGLESRTLSLDGKFDPDNISEKIILIHK
jgi:hypothetical protein